MFSHFIVKASVTKMDAKALPPSLKGLAAYTKAMAGGTNHLC